MESGKITYYVNEEKRVVIAKVANFHFELFNMIEKIAPFNKSHCYMHDNPTPSYCNFCRSLIKEVEKYPNEYCGIARAHIADEWDVEFGKKLARERVLKKINTVKSNVCNSILENIMNYFISTTTERNLFYARKANRSEDNITSLMGEIQG